jgi:hypothetical protein
MAFQPCVMFGGMAMGQSLRRALFFDQILDLAGKVCLGQTLKLIMNILWEELTDANMPKTHSQYILLMFI